MRRARGVSYVCLCLAFALFPAACASREDIAERKPAGCIFPPSSLILTTTPHSVSSPGVTISANAIRTGTSTFRACGKAE